MRAMLWEGKALRTVTADDVRRLVQSGLEEHLQLEYKSALYEDNDRGRREFLLDVCMFANAIGGVILIGIPERRDETGQPTGAPDPEGALGVEVENPEAKLLAYDASVTAAIEERLPLESAPINMDDGRYVLAIRVPNSANKPHSVRCQGHVYFPSRRERQRYELSVRQIKELVMRTASRLQQAEDMVRASFLEVERTSDEPYLLMGMIPVFFEDFLVDVRSGSVHRAVETAGQSSEDRQQVVPNYTFNGLERRGNREHIVELRRNGLLRASLKLPLCPRRNAQDPHAFVLTAIDVLLRNFFSRAITIYEAASIDAPFILGMMLRTMQPLAGAFDSGVAGYLDYTWPIPRNDYVFPFTAIDDLSKRDKEIRPLCDQAHQLFGRDGSPSFNANGVWTARY
jgi:Schlafen, AlbA_2